MAKDHRSEVSPVISGLASTSRGFIFAGLGFHLALAVRAIAACFSHPSVGVPDLYPHAWVLFLIGCEAVTFVCWAISVIDQASRLIGFTPAFGGLQIAFGLLPGSKSHPAAVLDETRRSLVAALRMPEFAPNFMGWWTLAVVWQGLVAVRLGFWFSGTTPGFARGLALVLLYALGCTAAEYSTIFVMAAFDEGIAKLRGIRMMQEMAARSAPPPPPTWPATPPPLPPRSVTPALGMPRSATPALGVPRSATPALGVPRSATPVLGTRIPSGLRPVRQKQSVCACCGQPASGARCDSCGAARRAGTFKVLRLLGQAANARTYLALTRDGTQVKVLKEFSFNFAPKPAMIDEFERQGVVLAQMSHPLIPTFDSAFTDGVGGAMRFYIAREFVPGRSLLEELDEGPLVEEEMVHVLSLLFDVLLYLHNRQPKVLHRDIKPSNIILAPDGQIALIDFGVSRDFEKTGEYTFVRKSAIEEPSVRPTGYQPPQQLHGQVDESSDLYAVGLTAVHLLTGEPPWEHLEEDLRVEIPSFLGLSPSLTVFLRRLTELQRERRYLTTKEAIRDFDNHVKPRAEAS